MKPITKAATLLLLLLSFYAQATSYYISPAGNDLNSGIRSNAAWTSIAKVNSTAFQPGDSILFEGGATFSGGIEFGANVKGTPSAPIYIGSYGTGRATISSGTVSGLFVYNSAGFKVQNLIFKGSGRETNKGCGVDFYMDLPNTRLAYIAIDNVEASGYGEVGITVGSYNGTSGFDDVSITYCSAHDNGDKGIGTYAYDYKIGHKNVYIAHSKAYDNAGIPDRNWLHSGNGIVMGGVDGGIIEYCESYNNGWLNGWTSGGPVGIWGYMCNNLIIQYNESHHNKTGTSKDGGGFDIDGGSTNSIMQYNYSHNNEGAGYLLAQFDYAPAMKNIIVRYNISENDGRKNGYGAIHIWSSKTGTTAIQNAQIYNNTVYLSPASSGSPKAVWVQAGGASQVTFRNNIFVTTGGVDLMNVEVPSKVRFEGNNYWSSGGNSAFQWNKIRHATLSAWQTATGQEMKNAVSVGHFLDPKLRDPGMDVTISDSRRLYTLKGYELQDDSPLIGKAFDLKKDFALDPGQTDYWGNSIRERNDLCIGAHQVTDNSTACEQGGVTPLAFGSVEGGVYAGRGVTSGGLFDPLLAGIGNHALRYTYQDTGGLLQVRHHTVTVLDATASVWTGSSGTSNWFETKNWSTCVPGSGVDVLIPTVLAEGSVLPAIRTNEHALTRDLSAEGLLAIDQGGTLEIRNDLLTANLSAAPLSSVKLQSESIQHIAAASFGKLYLSGTGRKKLTGSIKVSAQLVLDQTQLELGDHDLSLAGTGSILNYSPTSFIVTNGKGALTMENLGPGKTAIFPVGTEDSYNPVRLRNEGVTDNFSVQVEERIKTLAAEADSVEEVAINKVWHISEAIPGGSNVSMNLQWNTSDELPNFSRTESYVSHFEDGDWNAMESSMGTITSGTIPNTYAINLTGVTSFSPFSVVSPSRSPIPLPVTLVAFTAVQRDFDVLLEWATASELNNHGFEVEVSEDARNFRKIAFVESRAVNTQLKQFYSFRHKGTHQNGTRYYRLRQVDLDGTATFSQTKAVSFNKPTVRLSAYPNPFDDVVTLELDALEEQDLLLTITDNQGKQLYGKSVRVQKGFVRMPLDLSTLSSSTVYVLTVHYNNKTHHLKLLRN